MVTVECAVKRPEIGEVLYEEPSRSFSTIAHLPSNVDAIELGLLFATGRVRLAALAGPSGWGKSHILEATASTLAKRSETSVHYSGAQDWLRFATLTDTTDTLLLDNVQDVWSSAKNKQVLRMALEWRVRRGKATMLCYTSGRGIKDLRSVLPNVRDWTIANLPAPAPEERAVVLEQMSESEGLILSSLLCNLLASKMRGNGRTLSGALKRLRIHGHVWLDDESVVRACGILDPFFADNSDWDVRERVARACDAPDLNVTGLDPMEAGSFVMLRKALLPEGAVAEFYSTQPAKVYALARRFEKRLDNDRLARDLMPRLYRRIAENLSSD